MQGTFQLLDAARRHVARLPAERQSAFRFLHVSTDEVYGSLGPTGRFTETSPYDPSSPYSASKAAADHFARAYFRTYRPAGAGHATARTTTAPTSFPKS